MARNAVRIGWDPMMPCAKFIMLYLRPCIQFAPLERRLAHAATGRTELPKNAIYQFGRRTRGLRLLVFESHCLPFEGAELVKRLHLDPLNILHRRDKASDAFNVIGIVGDAWN